MGSAGIASIEPLLSLRGISKRFPGILAIDRVDFDVRLGEVHVLFGENGAGKSTLINVVAGTFPPDAGQFRFGGEDIHHLTPHRARSIGISPVFQEFSLVPSLTVEDNLFLGRELSVGGILRAGRMKQQARELIAKLGFDLDPLRRVEDLSRAHQQMAEIAKALLGEVRLLILDEPTASLTERETRRLFDLVADLKSQGIGVIYVSHRVREIRALADRITVLRDGRLVKTLNAAGVTDSELIELMTGRKIDILFPTIIHKPGRIALDAENLSVTGSVHGVNFRARAGEITGVAGLVGCGKSEVIRAIYGLEPLTDGTVRLNDMPYDDPSPRASLKRGLAYFPANRVTEGLALSRTVRENASMAALDLQRFARFGVLNVAAERSAILPIMERLKLRPPDIERAAGDLSGGNRQKAMLGRALIRDLSVFLFDEPTVGIDVGAKVEVYEFMKQLVEDGAAVVIVSSELPEVLSLSNRLYVMLRGRIVAELAGEEKTERNVLASFFGDECAPAEIVQMSAPAALDPPKDDTIARLGRLIGRVGLLPLLLVLLVVVMAAVMPNFYGFINILNILRTTSFLAIVSCGQALVLIAGGFDLSVGSTIALASVIVAKTMAWSVFAYPGQTATAIALGILAGLGSGFIVGLVNGVCVARLKISGFIVTLGTMSTTLGVALMITNGIPVYGMPRPFVAQFGRAQWFYLPSAVYIALAIIVLISFMQRRTLLGRYIYAIGGNPEAAVVSGVSIQPYQVAIYIISGVLAAGTGLLLTAQVGSGQASFGGNQMMLQSIAAAVIGGVSLRGGIGRIEMVAVSALFLTILANALNLQRIDSRLQPVFLGFIMIAAVALNEFSRRRKVLA